MSDTADNRDRIARLFDLAADLPAGERDALLARECAADTALRRRVETLLRAHDAAEAGRGPVETRDPDQTASLIAGGNHAPHEDATAEGVGAVIGRYRLVRRLGSGTFGTVFLADQLEGVQQRVALKRLNPGMNSDQVLARFAVERQALATMQHPNIAKVFDGGQTPQDYPYFVMEYVDGVPLTDFCEARRLPLRSRLELFAQICAGVQHAHSRGIIHRDLKPTNILVAEYDGTPTVKVIDFGIAKAVGDPVTPDAPQTLLGTVVGSLPYMSPEQASFETHDVDKRADIYALGAVLYELLTGVTPLDEWLTRRAAIDALLKVIRERVPPTPSSRLQSASRIGTATRTAMDREAVAGSRAIRGDLDWIVMKALEKDRDRRYDSAAALADDLQRHLGGQPVLARRPTVRYRLGKTLRRNRRAVMAVLLLLFAVAIGAVGTTRGLRRAAAARQAEAEQRERADDESRRAAAEAQRAAAADRRKFMQEYVDDLRTLPALWSQGATDVVRTRLQRYVPTKPGADDPRGFEWYYWDRQTHAAVATVKADPPATSLALSPDAHRLWFTDTAGRLVAWDVLTGKQTVLAPAAGAYGVVASADGTRLAVSRTTSGPGGQSESDMVILDRDGREQATIATRMGPFTCAALSPDGTRVATGDVSGDVSLWDAADGRRLLSLTDNPHSRRSIQSPARLDGHTGRISGVAFSPDGTKVASVDVESGLAVWTLDGRCDRREFELGRGRRPVGVTYSADGRGILVRHAAAEAWQSHPKAPGTLVLLAGPARPREIEVRDETPPDPPRNPFAALPGAAFGVDDQSFLTAVGDTLRVIDLPTRNVTSQLRGHTSPIVGLSTAAGGRIVATCDSGGDINVWTPQRQPGLNVVSDSPSPVRAMALCGSSGRRVVLADAGAESTSGGVTSPSEDKRLTLTDGGRPIDVEQAVGSYVGLASSPNGKYFASADAIAGVVIVWDSATGHVVRRFDPEPRADGDGVLVSVRGVAFRTDDDLYAIGGTSLRRLHLSDGRSERVDGATVGPTPTFRNMHLGFADDTAITLGFSPDGRLAALGRVGGDVEVFDAERWTPITRLRLHRWEVTGVQFSADGRRLVTSAGRYVVSGEGRPSDTPGGIVVWDTATWRDCLTLAVPGCDDVAGVAWADGGHTLVAAANHLTAGTSLGVGGRVVAWDTGPTKVADALADIRKGAATPGPSDVDPLAGKTLVFPSVAIARGGLVGFTSLAVHPSGDYVAAVDVRGTVVLWKPRTGEQVATGPLRDSSSWRIRFDPDGKTLHGTTFPFGNDVATLNVPGLTTADTPPGSAAADDKAFAGGEPVVSGDGHWQLERPDPAGRPDEVFVRDIRGDKLSERPHAVEPRLRAMVFFPDGQHFATIGGQNRVHLWSVKIPASPAK